MGAYVVTVGGKEYDVDAPDEKTAWQWANAMHAKSQVQPESPTSARNLLGAAVEPNLSMLSGAVSGPISGLAGIAGAVLPGDAGQGARWTEGVQRALTYQPRTEGGKTATEAISYPFRQLGQGADFLGEKVSEVTGSPAAGAGVNAAVQVGVPLAVSNAIRFSGRSPVEKVAEVPAKWLMHTAAKPAVTDTRSLANANAALETMLKEGINPTQGGMNKLQALVRELNSEVESGIANSPAQANVARVGSRLRGPFDSARLQVNPKADTATVRSVWDEFRNSPNITGKTDIPVQLAHELKKGTYRSLGGKSYGEVGSMSVEAQKALARGLREEVANNVPDVVAPLRREADLMNVRDVAERTAMREGNKNISGLAPLASNPYAAVGFLADRSAWLKAMLARALYSGVDPNLSRALLTGSAVNQEKQE